MVKCPNCGGEGLVPSNVSDADDPERVCPLCNGTCEVFASTSELYAKMGCDTELTLRVLEEQEEDADAFFWENLKEE